MPPIPVGSIKNNVLYKYTVLKLYFKEVMYLYTKHKFEYNLARVGWGLILFGSIYVFIAVIAMLTQPAINVNGVLQPPSMKNSILFSVPFGGAGLVPIIIGIRRIIREKKDEALKARLKQDGICIVAELTGFEGTNVKVNGKTIERLQCAYTDNIGTTYIFKSRALRKDPTPYLEEKKVYVYHELSNMKVYYVDVEGSAEYFGSNIIEL